MDLPNYDNQYGGDVNSSYVKANMPGDEDVQVEGGVRSAEHTFTSVSLTVAHQAEGGQVDVRPEEDALGTLSPLIANAHH